jgi:hypothetical protein
LEVAKEVSACRCSLISVRPAARPRRRVLSDIRKETHRGQQFPQSLGVLGMLFKNRVDFHAPSPGQMVGDLLDETREDRGGSGARR